MRRRSLLRTGVTFPLVALGGCAGAPASTPSSTPTATATGTAPGTAALDLLHAHGTREFTRSASVEVPEGVTCVVVRGHDQTHGYGGQAALVNLDSGATRFVRQGSEPSSFSADDCP